MLLASESAVGKTYKYVTGYSTKDGCSIYNPLPLACYTGYISMKDFVMYLTCETQDKSSKDCYNIVKGMNITSVKE